MTLRVGDKVRFLNDVGEGEITRIIDKKTVGVLNEYGFEVPTLINELIVIEAAPEKNDNNTDESAQANQQKETDTIAETEDNLIEKEKDIDFSGNVFDEEIKLYLGIVPHNQEAKQFDIFLINDSPFHLLYTFSFKDDQKVFFIEANKLESDTKIKLHTLKIEDANSVKSFQLQAIVFVQELHKYKKTIDVTIPFNPVKLYKEKIFNENEYFEEDAYIENILEENYFKEAIEQMENEEIEKVIREKERKHNPLHKNEKARQRKEFEESIEEVDLHIQELIDKVEGLENGEKLEIQLNHFENKLNEAIQQRKKKVVFIHGVGNGVLKVRLRNILDTRYKHLKYQDASFQQYGYGATLVFLRK